MPWDVEAVPAIGQDKRLPAPGVRELQDQASASCEESPEDSEVRRGILAMLQDMQRCDRAVSSCAGSIAPRLGRMGRARRAVAASWLAQGAQFLRLHRVPEVLKDRPVRGQAAVHVQHGAVRSGTCADEPELPPHRQHSQPLDEPSPQGRQGFPPRDSGRELGQLGFARIRRQPRKPTIGAFHEPEQILGLAEEAVRTLEYH